MIRISFGNLILQSYVLYVIGTLEIQFCSAKFFRHHQNHNQDQDSTLNFNTRTIFYILKTPTKFGLNSRIPSKVIAFTDGTGRQTDGKTGGQTEIKKILDLNFKTFKTCIFIKMKKSLFSFYNYNIFFFLHTPYEMRKFQFFFK